VTKTFNQNQKYIYFFLRIIEEESLLLNHLYQMMIHIRRFDDQTLSWIPLVAVSFDLFLLVVGGLYHQNLLDDHDPIFGQ
jgi:hypothetical protein